MPTRGARAGRPSRCVLAALLDRVRRGRLDPERRQPAGADRTAAAAPPAARRRHRHAGDGDARTDAPCDRRRRRTGAGHRTAGSGPPGSGPATTAPGRRRRRSTVAPSTTLPTLLDTLPPCPVDALDAAGDTVEITFWHGMTADLEKELTALTDRYNASQSKVRVVLQNQGGYEQVIDKYLQSGQDSRPELAQAPEYAVQVFRDTNSFVPVEACFEAAGLRSRRAAAGGPQRLLHRGRAVVDAVQHQQPGAVLHTARCSTPPASIRTPRRARWRSSSSTHARSSSPARRRTGSSSTRTSTAAAAGTSSSGSRRPASSTPTTRTAGRRRRRGCCSTGRPASTCSRTCRTWSRTAAGSTSATTRAGRTRS